MTTPHLTAIKNSSLRVPRIGTGRAFAEVSVPCRVLMLIALDQKPMHGVRVSVAVNALSRHFGIWVDETSIVYDFRDSERRFNNGDTDTNLGSLEAELEAMHLEEHAEPRQNEDWITFPRGGSHERFWRTYP